MGGLELSGQIGPTFFVLLFAAAIGLYIAAKYRTSEALKGAAEGWEMNARAQEARADRLEESLSDVKLELEHVRTELLELQKRAPDLKALYELGNANTTLSRNNSAAVVSLGAQMERVAEGVDRIFQHIAAAAK